MSAKFAKHVNIYGGHTVWQREFCGCFGACQRTNTMVEMQL